MTNPITIAEPIWPFLPDGRLIYIDIDQLGVVVRLDVIDPEYSEPIALMWEDVTNVELMSEKFRGLRVYEFKALCMALQKAYNIKDVA